MKFKIETLKGYQIMPTEFLRDSELSLKAKGLLATMYSLPNEWDYTILGLCKITKTGITAIRSILAELELTGYLKREETKNLKGQFEYNYYIRFKPIKPKNPIKEVLSLKKTKQWLTNQRIKEATNRI